MIRRFSERFGLRRTAFFAAFLGFGAALTSVYLTHAGLKHASTDEFCASCHVHPHATETWEESSHYKTRSGTVTHCVQCHLPPDGMEHYWEKAKAGARDVYGYYFKDISQIDWEAKATLEQAVHFTFDSACTSCHVELFPLTLDEKGVEGHLHYRRNPDTLRCINCHLRVGHYRGEKDEPFELLEIDPAAVEREMFPGIEELPPGSFQDYTETIPGTNVRFQMVAIQGGTFTIGSPPDEPMRQEHEGPQRTVQVSSFWMGKFEVTWDEYLAFYLQTATRGKMDGDATADAISGPTPPYGSPDQGWGRGARPAITMTHHAAMVYTEWLSEVTGRRYRLPTEAEWEFAARAGTTGPFFFDPVIEVSWFSRALEPILGARPFTDDRLQDLAWYRENSGSRTHPAGEREPNPWGLHDMLGNVREFCLDWYSPDAYARYPADRITVDPRGPESGTERVVRGGAFRSGQDELRSAYRGYTRHDEWMRTDPQTPKSMWWYSDNNEVGFRVVREFHPNNSTPSSTN